jgi:hypothetical protein
MPSVVTVAGQGFGILGGGGCCRMVHSEGLHGGTAGMRWAGHVAHRERNK